MELEMERIATGVPVERDWRFAALVARSWSEPALLDRYADDPYRVLAEYGLAVGEGNDVPSLARMTGFELVIEDLDRPHGTTRSCTACGTCVTDPQHEPAPDAVRHTGLVGVRR